MCCIFTLCSWMIDFIQRAWVFLMSFFISSAVCCVLITTSMSGIALGYNYSLAEFVDLKETNVSVYLKRGIFDDEKIGESDFRRQDGGSINGHLRDDDLITGEPEVLDFVPDRSGRRLDDSILNADEAHKFEGSLMKLTAKAPYQSATESTTVTSDLRMQEIISNYARGSPDQLKAIQGLINMRKAAAARDPNVNYASTYNYNGATLVNIPEVTTDHNYRRRFGFEPDQISNPLKTEFKKIIAARKAVPDGSIGAKANWLFPKLPPDGFGHTDYDYGDMRSTYPKPISLRQGPIRPTKSTKWYMTGTSTETPKAVDIVNKPTESLRLGDKPFDLGIDRFKENIAEKFDLPRLNSVENIKTEQDGWKKSEVDYYDDDIKGLPVRKKRSVYAVNEKLVTEFRHVNSKGKNAKIKEDQANKITLHSSNVFLNKLLSSNKPLSNKLSFYNESEESTKIKISKTNDNLNESTKRVATMIRSMFS